MSEKLLQDYEQLIKGKRCISCNELLPAVIEYYEHEYGWKVIGFDRKLWLYVVCLNCHYQNALWKLGVPRE